MDKVNVLLLAACGVLLVALGFALGVVVTLNNPPPSGSAIFQPAAAVAAAQPAQPVATSATLPAPAPASAPVEAEDADDEEDTAPAVATPQPRRTVYQTRILRRQKKIDEADEDGWYENFAEKFAAAKDSGAPFVLFYTSRSCPHCRRLEAIVESEKFRDWAAANGVVVCKLRGVKDDPPSEVAKDFAMSAPKKLKEFPAVACYRLLPDGTEIRKNFLGRRDTMKKLPAETDLDDVLLATLAETLAL